MSSIETALCFLGLATLPCIHVFFTLELGNVFVNVNTQISFLGQASENRMMLIKSTKEWADFEFAGGLHIGNL